MVVDRTANRQTCGPSWLRSTSDFGKVMAMAGSSLVDDSSWEQQLNKMAEQLKEFLDKNGKEKDPMKSASIFHEMGLLYKEQSKQDDSITKKLSLIRSAALLNASMTRQPGNEQFKQSLKHFCSDLLKTAGAKILDADLLKFGQEVKEMAENMRKENNESLQKVKNIPYDVTLNEQKELEADKIASIKTIQAQITENYKNMMKFVSNECDKIMGNPPCKYSITGMGSLARCEITPYSDFEHIILLEEGAQEKDNYPQVLEYFRWFSVVFQTIIINLQETIIPSVAIPSFKHVTKPGEKEFFDAFTKRGISFDGLMPHACKLPLGRMERTKKKPWTTELIKPVNEMLTYLDKDEDLKNGYRISDVLMSNCQVYGDEQIHQQFSEGVRNVLQSDQPSHHERLMQQLNEDLTNFDAYNSLKSLHTDSKCNIKRLVYRTSTLFISALGRLNSIDDGSSFAIIDQLSNNNIIDDETAHLLSYAIAVSCQVRLKVYMEKESQDDYVGEEQLYDILDNKVFANLMDTVGDRSMVDYFAIAYNLQNVIRNKDDLSNLRFNITLIPYDKFRTLRLLELHDRIISEWESYSQEQPLNTSEDELWIRYYVVVAYYKMHQYKESLLMLEWLEKRDIEDHWLKVAVICDKASCLYDLDRFQEALQFIGRVNAEVSHLNLPDSDKYPLRGNLVLTSAQCQYALKKYQLAIDQFMEASEYLARVDQRDVPWKEINRANCFYNIGLCLYYLGDYDAAINEVEKSLQYLDQHNGPVDEKCSCYSLLGRCHLERDEYDKALKCFQTELDLRLQFVPNEKQDSDEDIKFARSNIKICQNSLTPWYAKIICCCRNKYEHVYIMT
ncbi:unnamed protein product [Clavelina lepadiformis]|uniref:Protein-PII uridylyltransferase N-terminal domain-containing protein n=1 Tax=Clavelina lepadiformis TaxID=159417 RepID=A0ABP0F2D5_CLALP